jgi:glyoxylase-like metal-dependent hydrolase (beta-lactamase superfamily II)
MTEVTSVVAIRYTSLLERRMTNFLRYWSYGEADADITADFAFWVLGTVDGVVLVDTGFTNEAALRRRMNVGSPPVLALRESGHDPTDVTRIILTHLHFDHCGNLEEFPNATVYVQRSEYEFWTSDLAGRRQFDQLRELDYLEILRRIDLEGRLVLLDGDASIDANIDVILLGGHTVGTQAVRVRAAGRVLVLASDAVHFMEELDRDMPYSIVADLPAMYRSYDRLRELAVSGAVIIPGHDSSTVARFASRVLPGGAMLTDLLDGSGL